MTPSAPIASMGLALRHRSSGHKIGSRESWLRLVRRKPPHRCHPAAVRIAKALLRHRDILCLSSGRVIRDIRARFPCGYSTAALALTFARREVA